MDKNNNLTRFDEGKSHNQNALGGVPIGNNNSVEQGETKTGNFIYSNRIILDENAVSQYNLPKSLIGKSVADATKFIDNKFKGRNDKISQSTKDLMLSKIAEAQESMKPQDVEMESQDFSENIPAPTQMAFGGFEDSMIGKGFSEDATGQDQAQAIGAGINTLTSTIDLGKLAFGKPQQDTSGMEASADVNAGGMIGGSALKGATAGAALGPLGAGVGALVGGIAGLLGSKKAKKAALENSANFATRTNARFSDQYAYGGEIDPDGTHIMPDGTSMLNSEMVKNSIDPNTVFNTKNIVRYQPGVTSGRDGSSGFYLYSKLPTDVGFNYEKDREFVRNENMGALQRTPRWQTYMKNKSIQSKQFAKGGKLTPLDTQLTSNLELNPLNEIYTGKTINPADLLNNKNYVTSASINNFKQPNITPINMEQPTFGQKLKLAGKEALSNVKDVVKDVNFGNLARYAPIAMNAYQLSQLKKPQGEVLDRLGNRYKPQYVDEAALQNIANQNMNNTINAISQSGASEGQIRASILGSQLQRTKALSDAYNQAAAANRATDDRAQTFNLGVDQVNLNQSNTEKDINARNIGNYDTQKSRLLSQLGSDIGNVGREEVYKDIAENTTGYKWTGEYVKSPSGNVVTDPDTGKPMTKEKLEEIQKSRETNKKALGGYLMKNKK